MPCPTSRDGGNAEIVVSHVHEQLDVDQRSQTLQSGNAETDYEASEVCPSVFSPPVVQSVSASVFSPPVVQSVSASVFSPPFVHSVSEHSDSTS